MKIIQIKCIVCLKTRIPLLNTIDDPPSYFTVCRHGRKLEHLHTLKKSQSCCFYCAVIKRVLLKSDEK